MCNVVGRVGCYRGRALSPRASSEKKMSKDLPSHLSFMIKEAHWTSQSSELNTLMLTWLLSVTFRLLCSRDIRSTCKKPMSSNSFFFSVSRAMRYITPGMPRLTRLVQSSFMTTSRQEHKWSTSQIKGLFIEVMPSANNSARARSYVLFAASFLQCNFDAQNHSHFPFRSEPQA